MKIYIKVKGGPGSGNWAHIGRPGIKGGSATRDMGMSIAKGSTWLERYEARTGHKHKYAESAASAPKATDLDDVMDNHLDLFLLEKIDGYKPDSYGIGTKKPVYGDAMRGHAVTRELENELDMKGPEINAVRRATIFQPFLSSWAGSHVIESVARNFGITLSDYEKQQIADAKKRAKAHGKGEAKKDYRANGFSFHDRPMTDENMDRFTNAVYAKTQAKLKAAGIENLRVYRGSKMPGTRNTLTSYTIDKDVAEGFAKNGGSVEEIVIPRDRIWALPASGFGVPSQFEVILLPD